MNNLITWNCCKGLIFAENLCYQFLHLHSFWVVSVSLIFVLFIIIMYTFDLINLFFCIVGVPLIWIDHWKICNKIMMTMSNKYIIIFICILVCNVQEVWLGSTAHEKKKQEKGKQPNYQLTTAMVTSHRLL